MDRRDRRALEILEGLGGCAATPFFEQGPARFIMEALERLGVAGRRDAFGNLIVHYQNTADEPRPPIALVAHMDHPGFEVVDAPGESLTARAMGGVPAASLVKPVPVLVLARDGRRLPGIASPHLGSAPPKDRTGDRLVNVRLESPVEVEPPAMVVFDLPDFDLDGETIRMRAVDDLVGCAAVLAALERAVERAGPADVYGVFTRAEEVGLYGARLVAAAGTLPRGTVVVSVESSAVVPGVAQGEGPIIRTGDAASTFSAGAEQTLAAARDALRRRNPEFKAQRQLMSGGVCEGTAFAVYGYDVTGVAFPLANYHNATTRIPDTEGGVGAEYIHLSDFLGGVDLLGEAVANAGEPWEGMAPWATRAVPDDARLRLETTA